MDKPPRRRAPRLRSLVLTGAVVTGALALGLLWLTDDVDDDRLVSGADVCLDGTGPEALSTLFDHEPGGVIAADYQRSFVLPDGRTLWLFQDATFRLPPSSAVSTTTGTVDLSLTPPATERLVHNIGMVQRGSCFTVLQSGTAADPRSWLLAGPTTPFQHWFWPLGAEMANDGNLYVYVAEVFERGGLYLSATEPTGTRIVAVDLASMQVVGATTPPGSSPSLYGFSVASDATWTYLYGHCHRQFGWDIGPFGVPAHDLGCSGDVPVARVPKGQLLDPLQYWDGSSWQADPARAVSVMPDDGRSVNPSQVRYDRGEFVAVTKVDDWFGSTIYLDRAPAAHGPWENYARIPAALRCDYRTCNSYFASWAPDPTGTTGDYVIGLSHNRWDGQVSSINRPTFHLAPRPETYALAIRCALVTC